MTDQPSPSDPWAPLSGAGPTARPLVCPRGGACPSPTHHDNARAYDAGCRSRRALDDIRRAQRERTNHLVPIVGTARRLQALAHLGHSAYRLGRDHLFCSGEHVNQLRRPAYTTCWSITAARVDGMFLELSETEPLTDRGAVRARRDAQRRGWEPVEAWDGIDIDDPESVPWSGRRGFTPGSERDPLIEAEVARLAPWRSGQQIAWELGLSPRQVTRVKGQIAAGEVA